VDSVTSYVSSRRRRVFDLGVLMALFLLGQHIALPQTSPARLVVSRYVAAIQHRDYKTIVELDQDIKLNESVIQSENPKLLWPKLIAEYRERAVRELKGEDVKTTDTGDIGDYTRKEVDEQFSLVSPECKWAIAETRPGTDLAGHRFTEVFVTVAYPTREASPRNSEGQPLKRAILKFTVMAPDNSAVMNYERVLAGDVPW
jgi:hypothetical protein